MKKLLLAFIAISLLATACNSPIQWTAEMEEQITKQCLDSMAEQFKAEDPDEFCACFIGKMKEEEMGMMDMIKGAADLAKGCGAQLE